MIVPSEKAKIEMVKRAEEYVKKQVDFIPAIDNKEFYKELIRPHWLNGFEWGYSEAACEYFNQNIKLGVEIATLKERIEELEKELDG